MTWDQVKNERGVSPTLTSDYNSSTSPPFAAPTQTTQAAPLWAQYADSSIAKRVKVLEEAMGHSETFFTSVRPVLNQFASEVSNCNARLLAIDQAYQQKRACDINIGFLGPSGSGKSSLVNALLGEKILPTSIQSACTGVAVELKYNTRTEPKFKYFAEIEGIAEEEFGNELRMLFKDKQAYDEGPNGEEDIQDVELGDRIQTTFEKVKCLLPHLKDVDDLNKTSYEKIMALPKVVELLGKTIPLSAPSLVQFSDLISGYIEASKRKNDASAVLLWPLVKKVKVYVKSEILKTGITLVDLPGNEDTSASRNAVADIYRKDLNMACVTVPVMRGATNKVGQDLLSGPVQMNMQFDGLLRSQSLCYVITQCDDLGDESDVKDYIKENRNVADILQANLLREPEVLRRLADLDHQLKAKRAEDKKMEDDLQKLESQIRQREAVVDPILARLSKSGQKRVKRTVDDIEECEMAGLTPKQKKFISELQGGKVYQHMTSVREKYNKICAEIVALDKKKKVAEKERDNIKCQKLSACIKNRHEIQSRAVREQYEAKRQMIGRQPEEKPLQVFSVSARAFNKFVQEDKDFGRSHGFFTKADTGVPKFRDALILTTWELREANARTFNTAAQAILARLKVWLADTSADFKMSAGDRKILERRFDAKVVQLWQNISAICVKTKNGIDNLFKEQLYEKFPKLVKEAAPLTKKRVVAWGLLR